ncbi:MAG: glutamine--fructose-6-phosphate transaminase (isomerizing) [Clostridia bacterium]|nr:glutamine--fructose-6-phosphate transaminase (isomerizing) [Clostridia bacterium]
MCGIVGYIGRKQAGSILISGLERLEYRGYDSAGLAILDDEKGIVVKKARGRLAALKTLTGDGNMLDGTLGIGHTRWATHGEPSDVNSHPHLSGSGRVAVVHNGIIENYIRLKKKLEQKGMSFCSDTDSEVISQLVDYYYEGDPIAAVRNAMQKIEGSYALGILFADRPDLMIAICKDNPLIVGMAENEDGTQECYIASDVTAILERTRKCFRVNDGEMVVLSRRGITVFNDYDERIEREFDTIEWDAAAAKKDGYEHFMIKEILEQPRVIENVVRTYFKDGNIDLKLSRITDEAIKGMSKAYIVACGSAYHAGMVGRPLIERLSRIPVTVQLASEFCYDSPFIDEHTLVIIISQSGETIDSRNALRKAKTLGARTLSIVNVLGSVIAVESEDVLYTLAGPEIAVATTKAYMAQLALIYMLAAYMGRIRGILSEDDISGIYSQLLSLPSALTSLLKSRELVQYLASLYYNAKDIFFLGRNIDYCLALEGSLKLKEISYIHSEAYAAGELKHGTMSLIEEGTLVVALCTYRPLVDKTVSNIKEVKARGAVVIAIANQGDTRLDEVADHVIFINSMPELISPLLAIVPLQLFAYYMASLRGCDIDKPRNLAKSVTVE